MKKIIIPAVLSVLLLSTAVYADMQTRPLGELEHEDYGIHFENDNSVILEAKGTYRVVLKDGAVSGSLLSFSDVEGSEFDSVFVDNSTGEVVYSNSVSIDGDSIYLDSAAAEKIVASNVELEFLSSENIVETKELVASNSEYNDFD